MDKKAAKIDTLEQAKEAIAAGNDHMYLVVFAIGDRVGSVILASPKHLELYEAYFMIHESNVSLEEKSKILITNVIKLK